MAITHPLPANALPRFAPPEGTSRPRASGTDASGAGAAQRERQLPPVKGAGCPDGDTLQDWAPGFFPALQAAPPNGGQVAQLSGAHPGAARGRGITSTRGETLT